MGQPLRQIVALGQQAPVRRNGDDHGQQHGRRDGQHPYGFQVQRIHGALPMMTRSLQKYVT
jgi:hypothetical protein